MAHKHPFSCRHCDKYPRSAFQISPATEGWLKIYPTKKLVHVHFGRATVNEKESNSEAEWVYDVLVNTWFAEHPNTKFFIAADFIMEDDSEFPSERSKEIYQEILRHPQTSMVVCYRTTPAMRMFVTILVQVSRTMRKLKIVKTEEQMEHEYQAWLTLLVKDHLLIRTA